MEIKTTGGLNEVRQREVAQKRQRIQNFLHTHELDGMVLQSQSFFAWATGGGSNWVATDNERGVATLLHLANGQQYAFANNIEVPRLEQEEFLSELGYQVVSQDWWLDNATKEAEIWRLAGGKATRLGSDGFLTGAQNVAGELSRERWQLTVEEIDRYRQLGSDAATALETTCANLMPGLTEWEIAGQLAKASFERGLLPYVTLVATDERIFNYRHPIPTTKKLESYVMVVLCAKRGGLIANCTRLVHFGPLPAELKRKQAAVLQVDATFNLHSIPGAKVSEIFAQAQSVYTEYGFANEWQLHHQGGATGYAGRDYLGVPGSPEIVLPNQTFAWNPSIAGIKSEDTVLVTADGQHEVLTRAANSKWPTVQVEVPGLGKLERPLVLEK